MGRNITGEEYSAQKYIELPVREPQELMEFLMKQMSGISRNRAKDLLAGHAVTVDRKLVTQYNHMLNVGEVVRVTRHKRSTELINKHIKIIYEDKDIVVIEKQPGILSMASSPNQFCVKSILDDYFHKRHFKCKAHVVHRLDRETSGLMIYAKSIEMEQILEKWKSYKALPQELELPSAPRQFITYFDDPNHPQTGVDRMTENGMGICAGRLREDPIYDYKFVGLSHNTLRGAAGGAVEVAELLYRLGYFAR